ncbi:MAG: RimK family alpha-L-glutamate ligase [Thermoleophilia bacterium]
MSVALVTAAVARDLDDDLPPLCAALGDLGVEHAVVDWHDPDVDWAGFGLAVVRSVWDYVHRRGEMLAWAERVAAVTRLANPPRALAWSSDKRYLADLAAAGVPVVPTAFAEPGEAMDWPAGEVVVKPAVSAGSLDTARHGPGDRAAAEAHVARLHATGRTAMAQPYLAGVEGARAETALVHLGGAFSHAVRKAPMLVPGRRVVGDLFVEEDIRPAVATPGERAVARAALAAVPGGAADLLYARVDVVPGADGSPVVLELELVEPSLFLAHVPGAAATAARAVRAWRDEASAPA